MAPLPTPFSALLPQAVAAVVRGTDYGAEWPAPSIEMLSILAAILPALSYPFLPSKVCGPAAISISVPTLIIHLANLIRWVDGYTYADVPVLILVLTVNTLGLGISRTLYLDPGLPDEVLSGSVDEVPDRWRVTLWGFQMVWLTVTYQLIRQLVIVLGLKLVYSVENLLKCVLLFAGILLIIGLLALVGESWYKIHRQVALRRISWWAWLGDDTEFAPVWSQVLAIIVLAVVTPALLLGWAIGLAKSSSST